MAKESFSTRIDEAVLAAARKAADTERRSVTSLIEVAVLEYVERHHPGAASADHNNAA